MNLGQEIQTVLVTGGTGFVGCEGGSMVTEDYTAQTSKFNGDINWVQLDQGADDHDHLISPEERLHLAMTRQ